MKQNYTNDDEYKEILRKFMAIAFVELPDLQDAFEMLALELLAYDHNDNHENFIQENFNNHENFIREYLGRQTSPSRKI